MKKTNYLFMPLVMSILLISCGGKNEKKEGSSDEITSSESDCTIDQLDLNFEIDDYSDIDDYFYTIKDIKKNGEKDNFTGVAIEKDQNDSILNRVEVKNGWLLRYTHRIKIDNRYITISDYSFDNGEIKEGYKRVIEKEHDPKIEYISKLHIYKNGKDSYDWQIGIRTDEKIIVNGRTNEDLNWVGDYILAFTIRNMCLVRKNEIDVLKLKCLSNLEKSKLGEKSGLETDEEYEYGFVKYYENPDDKFIFKTLDDMKKELPKFDYWKK
jgi:hypothetical protein